MANNNDEQPTVYYSADNETFNYDSIGELMHDLLSEDALEPGRVYYEADGFPVTHEHVISVYQVEHLLENLDEQVYDDVGEVYDNDYSDVPAEAKEELRQLLITWAKKHVGLRYWRLEGQSRKKEFTAEEIAEYFA